MEGHRLSFQPTVLAVDDSPEILASVASMLEGRYRCIVATNGEKALSLAARQPQPDIILLDVVMPGLDGYEVCRRLKRHPATEGIPVIFLTSLDNHDNEAQGFAAGGVDYIAKPVSKTVLEARLNAQLTLERSRKLLAHKSLLLEEMVLRRKRQLSVLQDVIVFAMGSLAEKRDQETSAHLRRVQLFSRTLGLALREEPGYAALLGDDALDLLYKASPLHDIGKVGVPDSILFKQGRFSPDEFEAMKLHTMFGGQTLDDVERRLGVPEAFVSMARDIALYHHERWDGTGYPAGLKGEDIPIAARIVALADTYDALTSARVYKPPYDSGQASLIIQHEEGRQFDPALVRAFVKCEIAFRRIALDNADAGAAF